MTRKNIGWIALYICLISVTATVLDNRETLQPVAQAAALSPQIAQSPAVSSETIQACQAVADRIVTIQGTNFNKNSSEYRKNWTPLDECVAQEYQIDTSKCPVDFRMAVLRFIMTEDSARIHAHMDKTGKATITLGRAVNLFAFHSLSGQNSLINDDQKIADNRNRIWRTFNPRCWI
jgi:hypothetical protein